MGHLLGFLGGWPHTDLQGLRGHVDTEAARSGTTRTVHGQTGSYAAAQVAMDDGICVAVTGEPVWPVANHEVPQGASANSILAAFRQEGHAFLERLRGTFALALADERTESVLLAIDRMGIEQLSFAAGPHGILFGTSSGEVARFPGLRAAIRHQGVFDYFLHHMIPSPDTIYAGVQKLEPASAATYRAGRITTHRYWRPAFIERNGDRSATLEADLHSSLRAAVLSCHPDEATGAFLSGGLDSSTVAGILGIATGRPARTFSIGFGVETYNELEFAGIAARHFGFDAREYHVTPDDIVTALPLIAQAYDEPFGNSSCVPTYLCAKTAAQDGVRHLLAGDGGDELFGGNSRYAQQRVFEAYEYIPAVVRRHLIEPLAARIAAEHRLTPLRKFRSYVDQARIALPERFEYWNLMYRADASSMLDPSFQAGIDAHATLQLMGQVYREAPCRSLLNRMLFYDWHFTLADNDLRKVSTMCSLAGVKVSYPMLDWRVVELSTRVPPSMKMSGSDLRTFFKRAMRDFLPAPILLKRKHGFGLPFGVWLKTHVRLQDLIFSLLADLKHRRVVRTEFLDQLIREQRAGDESYFGYAIWDLAILEAWLASHSPSFTAG